MISLPRFDPMHLSLATLKWGSLAAIGGGALLAFILLATDASSLASRYWVDYTSFLDRSLRALFVKGSGRQIALYQISGAFGVIALGLVAEMPYLYVLLPVIAVGPKSWINGQKRMRSGKAEEQLSGFLQLLANALKSNPSIASGMESIVAVLDTPLKEEVGLALRELRVGSPLDQALLHMASRLSSRALDAAISTILIGRQVGGDLPKILETIGSTLREMSRLESVVRSKTADTRNQLRFMTAMPIACLVILNFASPGYFNPLLESSTGYIIIVASGVGWIGALVWARLIQAVDV